jgi:hypothetical protein
VVIRANWGNWSCPGCEADDQLQSIANLHPVPPAIAIHWTRSEFRKVARPRPWNCKQLQSGGGLRTAVCPHPARHLAAEAAAARQGRLPERNRRGGAFDTPEFRQPHSRPPPNIPPSLVPATSRVAGDRTRSRRRRWPRWDRAPLPPVPPERQCAIAQGPMKMISTNAVMPIKPRCRRSGRRPPRTGPRWAAGCESSGVPQVGTAFFAIDCTLHSQEQRPGTAVCNFAIDCTWHPREAAVGPVPLMRSVRSVRSVFFRNPDLGNDVYPGVGMSFGTMKVDVHALGVHQRMRSPESRGF